MAMKPGKPKEELLVPIISEPVETYVNSKL
jgi:hypothetical protein